MTKTLSRLRDRASTLALGAFLALAISTPAHAAGSSMPWEAPLQSILESIQGPVAKIMAGVIINAPGRTPAVRGTSRSGSWPSPLARAGWGCGSASRCTRRPAARATARRGSPPLS
uniref:TrbC/VirB2 family protein n=1 Tax=uncultured Sphingorhabdus sp. TaxID=1686106 RepID=UPI002603ABCB